jgi:glycosyltransferase involved in cell wall biosynthesis
MGHDSRHLRVLIVTSIHPDFDARIWKHARSLVDAGCQVRLICPWRVGDGEVRNGVELRPFGRVQHRLLRPLLIPVGLGRQLLPAVRDADIVHFHDIDILPWMALLSIFRTVVYDVHENYPDEMLAREWIPRLLRRPLYHIVGAAETLLARVVRNCVLVVPAQDVRFAARRLRVIHIRNYATRGLLDGVRDDYGSRKDTVVFTGAHHANNGSLLLLDIAARSRTRGLDLKFLMTDRFSGDGFRRRLLGEIERLGLGDRVVIRPYVAAHEIMSVLNEGTVAMSPNLRVPTQEKGIHTKLFEYMAAGLPIIASDLPSQVELIGGAGAGLLARPEEPETFVDALAQLVSDRVRAQQLGVNGQRAFLERYCWETQMPSLLAFYDSIRPRAHLPRPNSAVEITSSER